MAKKKTKAVKAAPETAKHIPIVWHDDQSAVFANQMLVQVDGDECHLSFFEIKPPFIMGTPEEQQEQVKNLKSVPARCVSRVVISKGRLPKFIEALQTTLEKAQAITVAKSATNGKGHLKR